MNHCIGYLMPNKDTQWCDFKDLHGQQTVAVVVKAIGVGGFSWNNTVGNPFCDSAWRETRLVSRPVAKGDPGGPGTPQATQGIVNTVFLLYCGFNFSESNH